MALQGALSRPESLGYLPNRGNLYLVVDKDGRPLGYLTRGDVVDNRWVGDRIRLVVPSPLREYGTAPDYLTLEEHPFDEVSLLVEQVRSRCDEVEHGCWLLRVLKGEEHLGRIDGFRFLAEAHGYRVR